MNSNDMIDRFKDSFKEESIENISDIEQVLLNIEGDNVDKEVVNSIFRNFHTIKGSAGMFGFNLTASIVHEIETVLDCIKQGNVSFNQDIVDSTLMAVDFIRELIEGDESIDKDDFKNRETLLIDSIKKSLNGENSLELDNSSSDEISTRTERDLSLNENVEDKDIKATNEDKFRDEEYKSDTKTYKIIFIPAKGLLFHGHKPINLVGKLLNLGEGQVKARVSDIPDLERIAPDNVYTRWEIKLTTEESRETLKDIFIFLDEHSKIIIEEVNEYYEIPDEDNSREKIEFESENNNLNNFEIEKHSDISSNKIKPSFYETSERVTKSQDLQETKNTKVKTSPPSFVVHDETSKSKVNIASIKVDSKKLDHLVNLVGELVTIQSKLAKESENQSSNILNSISAEFSFLINELRDYTTGLRTVPIEILFVKFQRVVKDLSTQLGKSILYDTQGGDTVLDKSIIEKLNEPLIHLIRNSIDHGIETIEERSKTGKNPQGVIKLSAYQAGDSVVIIIEDDGRGLDKNKLLKKAIEKGLINESVSKSLSDKEIYNLIFESGFSTAASVTSISGRGVGMDVVRKQVESLRGSVILESEFGKYTRTKLVFPLTLAIIEGWLVRVKDEHFIVPLSSVESCLEADTTLSQVEGMEGRNNVMNYRGSIISYLRLREFFEIDNVQGSGEQVVVANTNGGRIGLIVDEILGQHQTVVKTLGKLYSSVDGVSGATILGDGSLALVIDIDSMTKFMR